MSSDRFEELEVPDAVLRSRVRSELARILLPDGRQVAVISNRLRDCVDAAPGGQLAIRFPDLRGKHPVIPQLDCYRTPATHVRPKWHLGLR